MKNYFYLTEHSLLCCGNAKKIRYETEKELQNAFGEMACFFPKRSCFAVLVLEASVEVQALCLPPGSRKDAAKMAEIEGMRLAAGAGENGFVSAVRVLKHSGKKPSYAVVYRADKKVLEAGLKAADQAGISIKTVVSAPEFLARISYQRPCPWKTETAVVICIWRDGIRVLGTWQGICLAWKRSELKPEVFLRLGGEELLYEELTDLAAEVQTEMKCLGTEFEPGGILFLGDGLDDLQKGAEAVGKALALPWLCLEERDVLPEHGKGRPAFGSTCLKGCFHTANKQKGLHGPAAAGVCLFIGSLISFAVMGWQVQREILMEQKRLEALLVQEEEGRYAPEDERKKQAGFAQPSFVPALELLSEPGMEILRVTYEGKEPYWEITVRADRPDQMTGFTSRLEKRMPLFELKSSQWQREESGDKVLGVIGIGMKKEHESEAE